MTFIYFIYILVFMALYFAAISLTYMKIVEGIFIKLPRQELPIYIIVIVSAILFIFIIWNFIEIQRTSPQKAFKIFLYIIIFISLLLSAIFYIQIRNQKIKKDEYQRKKNGLIQALKKEPENFGLILKVADLYYKEGNFDEAIEYYKRAVSLLKNPEISLKAKERIREIEYTKKSEENRYPVKCPYCGTQNSRYSFRCRKCHKKLHSSLREWIYTFTNIYERIGLIIVIIMIILFLFTLPIKLTIILLALLGYIIFLLMH